MKKILIILEIVIILGSLFSDDFWASFWAGNVVLELPFLIPYIIFISIKKSQITTNKQNLEKLERETQLDSILQKCKKDGSLEDVENLKNLVEQNIKTHGLDIEFLELNFAIAKLYNNSSETEKAEEYFNKVKNIVFHLTYEDLCLLAKKSVDNKDFHDAVFYYSCILLYNKTKNNKELPEIYYNRALTYLGFNQESYTNKAIEDLKTAITKTKEISETLSHIEVESFLEGKLDKYNFKIGEIYQDLKNYKQAIEYYTNISSKSSLKKSAQEFINKCTNLEEEKECLRKEELKQKISKINNEEAEKYFKLGIKKKKEYDYDSAIEYFNKAINKNSKNAKYYYEKGLLYKENYNPNKAKEELNKAISIESDNALYYYTRAEINYFQRYYKVAVNDYTKGYELDEAPSNVILNHMENCLSFFLRNGQPKHNHFYLYAQLLVNKKVAKDYTYKTAVNELDKAIKRESLSEYYILRAYARCKYLLTTKDKAFLDSEFESLINDLIKIKEKNDNGNNEPCEFLKINYNQLLDWTKRKLIKRSLVLHLENLNKEIKDEIEANKINTAWRKINSNEEIKPKEQAENYYIVAVDFFNKKQISKAKYYIQKAIEIFSLEKYSELLKQIINKENEKWNKKVTKAEKFLKNKKLEDAKIIYEELSKIKPKSKDIQDKCNIINNSINQSKSFYTQGLKKFKEGNIEEAEKQINSAIGINNEKQFLGLLNNIVKYENFIDEFNKNNYQTAYKLINELINIYPNNNVFLEDLENTKQKLADYLYQCSINYINDGSYDKAIQDIEEAIKIFSNNEDFKNVLNTANNKLVDIKTCNKGAILTLYGFDEEKAEQFIQDRKTMNWYDLDSFAKYFNLQPHEQVMIEERIVFPLKPQVKKGRKIDI